METTFVTTSQPTHFLFEIESGDVPIPPGKLAYFQERLRNNIYHFVLTKFLEKEREGLYQGSPGAPARQRSRCRKPPSWRSRKLDLRHRLATSCLVLPRRNWRRPRFPSLNRAARNFVPPEGLESTSIHIGSQHVASAPCRNRSLARVCRRHVAQLDPNGGTNCRWSSSLKRLISSSVVPSAQSNNACSSRKSLPTPLSGGQRAA